MRADIASAAANKDMQVVYSNGCSVGFYQIPISSELIVAEIFVIGMLLVGRLLWLRESCKQDAWLKTC